MVTCESKTRAYEILEVRKRHRPYKWQCLTVYKNNSNRDNLFRVSVDFSFFDISFSDNQEKVWEDDLPTQTEVRWMVMRPMGKLARDRLVGCSDLCTCFHHKEPANIQKMTSQP